MKNVNLFLVYLGLLFTFACEDNLNLVPVSQLSTSTFYQTESDFEQAILAVYNSFRREFGDIILYTDIRSDNTVPVTSGSVTTRSDFDNFSILSTNASINGRWSSSYNAIARINGILDRIDEASIKENLKLRIKGEALFGRGLVYFNLVRIYGNIPLILNEISGAEALEFPQSSPDKVYAQIVEDLTQAIVLLPPSFGGDDVGRATSTAANALLGRIQLTNGDYVASELALRLVTAQEGNSVDLLGDYSDIFDINNEYNAEIIFAVRWTNDGVNGNGFNYGYTRVNAPSNTATTDLYNEYESGDIRRDHTLNTTVSMINILIYKYGLAPNGQGESDWPVIRYSDVLLMLAESLNEQGYIADSEAFTLINRVRTRAGLPKLTSATIVDKEAFRLAIEHERRVEFASEGHRWFDLVRTNRYVPVMSAKGFNVETHHKLFPIPEGEIFKINDENILRQNPGYD